MAWCITLVIAMGYKDMGLSMGWRYAICVPRRQIRYYYNLVEAVQAWHWLLKNDFMMSTKVQIIPILSGRRKELN